MLTHQPIHTPPCIPTIMQTSSVGVLNAADGHADVFLSRVANDLWQVPHHRSEPNLHGRQRRGCPEKGIGACASWKLPAFILWPPGKASNPLGDVPLPLLNHSEPALSVFPAVNAPPIPSVNVVHSPSEGTCHPEGQRPRASLTACQLYNRPYDASEKASLQASPPGAGP